jgi:hypothetical protein
MPEIQKRKVYRNRDLWICEQHAIRERSNIEPRILTLEPAPAITMASARKLDLEYGAAGEHVTMKVDFLSSQVMTEYLREQLVLRGGFSDHEVCDVGFWDLDVSTDSGFSWHHDHNWNSLLRPDHRSYHGWFVNSCTADCNSTLAISTDYRFNECNANEVIEIGDIRDNDVIKPDVIVPLAPSTLALFPLGAVHRTLRWKPPEHLVGHRLCTSFVLHHREDGLNDAKLAGMTDDDLSVLVERYVTEKLFETGHYMVQLLEAHPRTAPLVEALLAGAGDL